MGLAFTNTHDRRGAAVYILSDGSPHSERQLSPLVEEINQRTNNTSQVVLLNSKTGDGLRVKEFYGLMTFPAVAIVMDDDTIYKLWEGTLPRAQEITFTLSQVNGHMSIS